MRLALRWCTLAEQRITFRKGMQAPMRNPDKADFEMVVMIDNLHTNRLICVYDSLEQYQRNM